MKRLLNLLNPWKADDCGSQLADPQALAVVRPLPPAPQPLNQDLEERILADGSDRDLADALDDTDGDSRLPMAEASSPHETLASPDGPGDDSGGRQEQGNKDDVSSRPQTVEEPAITGLTRDEDSGTSRTEADPAPLAEPSLLGNVRFVKLVEECVDIMNEFDGYAVRLTTDEGRMIVQMAVQRLQEALERSGLSRISDEDAFSILRHTPVPMAPVAEATPVSATLSSGLSLDNRVFRKARVKIGASGAIDM